MIIKYLSDIHLELVRNAKDYIDKITPDLTMVCILSGDIGNPYETKYGEFMEFINTAFKKTFVIAGNHEYYNNNKLIEETNIHLQNYFLKFENIVFLCNTCYFYEDRWFIGTTLWSVITNPRYKINDVNYIKKLDHIKYNQLNEHSVEFLNNVIQNKENVIIITHHVPSDKLTNAKYKNPMLRPYNQWFVSDMDNFINNYKDRISGWFYGHTHTPSVQFIDGVQFLCNPIGYKDENDSPDFNKTVEIL
jgi:predicted phosphodiesterase